MIVIVCIYSSQCRIPFQEHIGLQCVIAVFSDHIHLHIQGLANLKYVELVIILSLLSKGGIEPNPGTSFASFGGSNCYR